MTTAILPAACLCAAFGLTLSVVARRCLVPALILVVVLAGAGAVWHIGLSMDIVFLGTWISAAVIAASIHLGRDIAMPLVLITAAVVGFWVSAGVSLAGEAIVLLAALPCLLIGPLLTFAMPRYPIVAKVLASWLIAIAILSAGIPFAGTPGYAPDHME